jgi:hypothetical protein
MRAMTSSNIGANCRRTRAVPLSDFWNQFPVCIFLLKVGTKYWFARDVDAGGDGGASPIGVFLALNSDTAQVRQIDL